MGMAYWLDEVKVEIKALSRSPFSTAWLYRHTSGREPSMSVKFGLRGELG